MCTIDKMLSTSLNVEPFLSKAVFAWMINKTEYKIIKFEKVTFREQPCDATVGSA